MKMCCVFMVASLLFPAACMSQVPQSYTREYWRALDEGACAKVTLKVTDESGKAVTNANAKVYFDMLNKRGNVVRGVTDAGGEFCAEGLCADYAVLTLQKSGYYDTRVRHSVATRDPDRLKSGRWLPWNPMIPVVLREIRNPIPMYVKYFSAKFPNGASVGFDCEIGDLVAPYGEGKFPDFYIVSHVGGIMYKKTTKDILLLSMDQDEGFRIAKLHTHSYFKSEYSAPETGYSTNLFASSSYDSSGPGFKGTILYAGDSYLIFKSRVKRDNEGKIVSANYGKIYNEIAYGGSDPEMKITNVSFLYYFNPTPNDRNLEFDGKNNLFRPTWKSQLNWSQEP